MFSLRVDLPRPSVAAAPLRPSAHSQTRRQATAEPAAAMARRVLEQARDGSLSPARLALAGYNLPPDERCWLIEGLCAALRDRTPLFGRQGGGEDSGGGNDDGAAAELAELRGTVEALRAEVAALRADAPDRTPPRGLSLSSTPSAPQLGLHGPGTPATPPSVGEGVALARRAGAVAPWRGTPSPPLFGGRHLSGSLARRGGVLFRS